MYLFSQGLCDSCLLYTHSFALWVRLLLEVDKARDEIAQAYTHTKAYEQCLEWDGIMLSLLCFILLFCFPWFIHPIWNNSYSSSNEGVCSYFNLIISHAFSISFLLTTSNIILYLLHSHFASSQRLLNPLPLFMLDAYPLQVLWSICLPSYPLLDNASNISLGFLVSM